jgi:dihydropteroate synthase
VVNVTPDSFSDGGAFFDRRAAIRHGLDLVGEGADIVDVGGESGVTYTGATAEDVERDRVVPVVRRLAAEGVAVSVDTYKPAVARAAVAAGAVLLNDVSGLRDPELADVAAATGAGLVVMHTRAAPKEARVPDYGGDVVGDVVAFLRERCAVARDRGVAEEQLVVDPGPDFAKRPAETVAVLRALGRLGDELGRPVLAAISRKYVLGAITGRPPAERLPATLAALGVAAEQGAGIVRVHDVAAAVDHLRTWRVLTGREELGSFDEDDDGLKWIRAKR